MLTDVMPVLGCNEQLMRRARFAEFSFCVRSGEQAHLVTVDRGQVSVVLAADGDAPAFTLSASASAWQEYAKSVPAPGYQDVIAMIETGRGEIDGRDMLPFFSNLYLVKGIVAALVKGDASW